MMAPDKSALAYAFLWIFKWLKINIHLIMDMVTPNFFYTAKILTTQSHILYMCQL
jgi:hypothetical protein